MHEPCALPLAATLLIKNHKDTDAARADAVLLFATARKYVAALAAKQKFNPPNILTTIASSQIYQIANQFGNSLAQLLPSKVPNPLDRFASNYTQSVLPGLTTALTGAFTVTFLLLICMLTCGPALAHNSILIVCVSSVHAGLSYSPCLLDASALGAIAGATGIGISPKIFNTGQPLLQQRFTPLAPCA